jgi:hypothetical protein
MAKRPCLEPGCPVLVDAGRCTKHRRALDRARGTRQERGYDAAYDQVHREYQARMDAGEVFICWRCPEIGRPSHPVDPRPGRWHLGHSNDDRSVIRGPQCPASNLATAPPRP